MKKLLASVLLLASTAAFGGKGGAPSAAYDSIGVRSPTNATELKAGETVEVEVVTTSKLGALGIAGLKAGDKVTIKCVTPGSLYTATYGKTTVKLNMARDGSVSVAK